MSNKLILMEIFSRTASFVRNNALHCFIFLLLLIISRTIPSEYKIVSFFVSLMVFGYVLKGILILLENNKISVNKIFEVITFKTLLGCLLAISPLFILGILPLLITLGVSSMSTTVHNDPSTGGALFLLTYILALPVMLLAFLILPYVLFTLLSVFNNQKLSLQEHFSEAWSILKISKKVYILMLIIIIISVLFISPFLTLLGTFGTMIVGSTVSLLSIIAITVLYRMSREVLNEETKD